MKAPRNIRRVRSAISWSKLALALVVVSVAAAPLVFYRLRLADNFAWAQNVKVARETRLHEAVFNIALDARLVRPLGNWQIELASCEPPDARQADPALRAARDLLCDSPQGAEVRSEIETWNRYFSVVAVRDNRPDNGRCSNPKLVITTYVPEGCKPNAWRAERVSETGIVIPVPWTPRAVPPPTDFSLIAEEIRVRAGDWAAEFGGSAGQQPAVVRRMSTEMVIPVGKSNAVVIDVVGALRRIEIQGGGAFVVNPRSPETTSPRALGPYRFEVTLLCKDCDTEPAADSGDFYAYAVTIWREQAGGRGAAGTPVRISLDALPENDAPQRDCGPAPLRRTLHLEMNCPTPGNPRVRWLRTEAVENVGRTSYRIVAKTGGADLDLVDPTTGLATTETLSRGLLPLVGFGPLDWGSLTATLASSSARASADRKGENLVRLSIDLDMQAQATKLLEERRGCGGPRTGPGATRACAAEEGRRAVLVLVDAEDNPGAIRVLASWPAIRSGLHVWDLTALGNSPLSGLGWLVRDGFTTPGSTFKAVTAMAAIEAVLGPNPSQAAEFARLARLLKGDLSFTPTGRGGDTSPDFLGLQHGDNFQRNSCTVSAGVTNTLPVPNPTNPYYCARNFGQETFAHAAKAPSATRCPTSQVALQTRLGLCEAMSDSSNLFFGGLALKIAQVHAQREPANAAPAGLRYLPTQMARRLSFPELSPAGYDLTRTLRVPRLTANAVHIEVPADRWNSAIRTPDNVVRSGFGQNVQATPLAMATIYASIGKGSVVRPTLLDLPRDASGCPTTKVAGDDDECGPILHVPPTAAAEQKVYLDILRAGFRAVTLSGTASARFASCGRGGLRPQRDTRSDPLCELRERLFAKTGTATVKDGGKDSFALWLAGWVEGKPGTGIPKRLGFACWVSHGGATDVGSAACGPLVYELLLRIEKAQPAARASQ